MLGSVLVRALCVCVAVCLGPAAAHSTRVNVTAVSGTAPAPASHGGGDVPQQPSPEFHRKLIIMTEVYYNGKTYSLLSRAESENALDICQSVYLPLEPGYALAPDDADSIAVIATHNWNAQLVVVASGNAYNTANYGVPGILYGSGYLLTTGVTYRPNICTGQILQVIYIHVL
jgi:hypothetical protein